ncbi:unnamed protein product [Caenorhabditis nigoni]
MPKKAPKLEKPKVRDDELKFVTQHPKEYYDWKSETFRRDMVEIQFRMGHTASQTLKNIHGFISELNDQPNVQEDEKIPEVSLETIKRWFSEFLVGKMGSWTGESPEHLPPNPKQPPPAAK